MPQRCSSLSNIDAFVPAARTAYINSCHTSLRGYDGIPVTQAAPCFAGYGANLDSFDATSAFSCISSASIYCQSTSSCAPAATASAAPIVIPEFTNNGFEHGSLENWKVAPAATPENLISSISSDVAHSGQYSLKIQFNNLASENIAISHRVRFEPGARYKYSFWYYSAITNQSPGTLGLKAEYPGSGLMLVIGTSNVAVGRWIQQTFTITPTASFGSVVITYAGTKGTVGNVFYIDDVSVTKV